MKGPAFVSAVLLLSFAWGYKKDAIRSVFSPSSGAPADAPAAPAPTAAAVAPVQPAPEPVRPAAPPVAFMPPAGPPPMGNARPLPPPGGENNVPGVAEYTQPANPYEELSKKMQAQQQNITNTFDTIRRDEVDQKQALQKNAYFAKLSEQLKELQGQPPVAGDSPNILPPMPPPQVNAGGPPVSPDAPNAGVQIPSAEDPAHVDEPDSGAAAVVPQPEFNPPQFQDEPTEDDLDEENL